eukprot:UN24392
MSSGFYYRHRFGVLFVIYLLGAISESVGILIFDGFPTLQVLSVFISSIFSSFIYYGILSFVEGRAITELILSIITFSFIFANQASRGFGLMVLEWGISAEYMPLICGIIGFLWRFYV